MAERIDRISVFGGLDQGDERTGHAEAGLITNDGRAVDKTARARSTMKDMNILEVAGGKPIKLWTGRPGGGKRASSC